MPELTETKQRVLNYLNEKQAREYEDLKERSIRSGKQAPPPPVPLEPVNIEYPKCLWNKSGEYKIVKDQHAHKALGVDWAEVPPKKE